MHYDDFDKPYLPFLMGWLSFAIIIMVEFINLYNLQNINSGGTYQIMFDFIALGIIAEFDTYFV